MHQRRRDGLALVDSPCQYGSLYSPTSKCECTLEELNKILQGFESFSLTLRDLSTLSIMCVRTVTVMTASAISNGHTFQRLLASTDGQPVLHHLFSSIRFHYVMSDYLCISTVGMYSLIWTVEDARGRIDNFSKPLLMQSHHSSSPS